MISLKEAVFNTVLICLALIIPMIFVWLLWDIIQYGYGLLSWNFLSSEPLQSGRAGGILPILISTALILLVALSIAIPLGLGTAIWLAEFQESQTHQQRQRVILIRLCLDVLAGVPSIVFGLFGYAFFCVYLGLGYSILAGGLTLACMILPLLIRICESGLRAVSIDYRKAGMALGMSRTRILWSILLPSATPTLMAGLMLAIGRASAETAALLFTSGYVDRIPTSLFDSGRAISVHIYDLSMNVTGGDKMAYASALVLILFIILIHIVTYLLSQFWLKRQGVAW